MNRCIFLLLTGLVSVSILSSCAKPVSTGSDSKPSHKIVLKDMGNGICHQVNIGLMWQMNESRVFDTWQEADEYAKNLQLGGFDDWRLPTRDECLVFSELLLLKKSDCRIKSRRSHWVQDREKGHTGYWEDYPLCGGPEFRWIKSGNGAVRAVRP